MKTIVYIATFIFSFYPFLCFANTNGVSFDDDQPTDKLYFMGSLNYTVKADSGRPYNSGAIAILLPPEELAFTSDDIVSYNTTTEEIVFTDLITNEMHHNYPIFNIYYNDTLLLDNIIQHSPFSSSIFRDLILYCDDLFAGGEKFYLRFHGKPLDYDTFIDLYGEEEYEIQKGYLDILQKRYEKRKEGMDIFIQYLSDNGKIIENVVTAVESIDSAPSVEIFSVGRTIYIKNPTGKNGIASVYGINGVKVEERTMAGETTAIEMPVSGFYIVSVQAGNEKPVKVKVVIGK